jgi:hypothetical protein
MATSRRRSNRKSGSAVPVAPVLPAPVRLSRVRVALKRIESGYYDRDEVRSRLALAVLEELKARG